MKAKYLHLVNDQTRLMRLAREESDHTMTALAVVLVLAVIGWASFGITLWLACR